MELRKAKGEEVCQVKVLGISSSPRKGGNTDILLDNALEGARLQGADVKKIRLIDFEINPCKACDACFKTGECVQQDGMRQIYPLLVSFDGIILAAPIFSMGLCGQAKVMIDRLQCFWARKNILKIEVAGVSEAKRRGLFISTAGSNIKGVFDAAIPTVRYFFAMIDIHDFEVLTFSGVDEMGAILRIPGALEKAREAGEKIVRDVRDLR